MILAPAQINDTDLVIYQQKNIKPDKKIIEGFSRSCGQMSLFEYLIFVVGLAIILFLIYYLFFYMSR